MSLRRFDCYNTALLVALAAQTGCTALFDRSWEQCRSDADCAAFGPHPICESGVCVEKGLGPQGCFYGSPSTEKEFLNQCTDAKSVPFDDCARGLCDESDGAAGDTGNIDPPTAPPAPSPTFPDPSTLPPCMDPSERSQVLYISGSSNFVPLLKQIAPLVLKAGVTPVFQLTSSCRGVRSMYNLASPDHRVVDPPGNATFASYYAAAGQGDAAGVNAVPCTVGPGGVEVDIGESEIYSETCGFPAASDGIQEYLGPNIAILFVVPRNSQQTAISADVARYVFGRGGRDAVAAPWNDPTYYFVRNSNTATQQLVAHSIGVPANEFWGSDRGNASNVDNQLRVIQDDDTSQKAIGLLSTDFYDQDRGNLKALAFKAQDQTGAYLPDSTYFNRDKRNVRDGHYPIWGAFHFFTKVIGGVPVSVNAETFLSTITLEKPPTELLDANIASSLVPDCAMMVKRSSELGALVSYSPPFHCGCYFDASVNAGVAPDDCKSCTTATECHDLQRPACNFGYCEVR